MFCDVNKQGTLISGEFSVMQYNILGDIYASPQWFPQKNKNILEWENRRELITQKMTCDPDIVCMEELDKFEYFDKIFGFRGYKGHFAQRPNKPDGCGIFFKSEKFKEVENYFVDYDDNTNRIATILHLKYIQNNVPVDSEYSIFIASTHLFWDDTSPKQETEIEKLLQFLQKINSQDVPTIICGDFNSTPTQNIYKIIIKHGYKSAYVDYKGTGQHPKFTSYKSHEDTKCIDYIFYKTNTKPALQLMHVLDLQEEQVVKEFLPNSQHPSDHLPIFAKFSTK